MTRRTKLILAVRNLLECELLQHFSDWDYVKTNRHALAIEALTNRLPVLAEYEGKISSQRKLFY